MPQTNSLLLKYSVVENVQHTFKYFFYKHKEAEVCFHYTGKLITLLMENTQRFFSAFILFLFLYLRRK